MIIKLFSFMVFNTENQLYVSKTVEIILIIKSSTSELKLTSKTAQGVAKFPFKLSNTSVYTFNATLELPILSDLISNFKFTISNKDYSLKILSVNSNEDLLYPTISWDSFYVVVGIYDLSGSVFLNTVNKQVISLDLIPVSNCSGKLIEGISNVSAVNGIANFTKLKIKSLGYFRISIDCPICIQELSPIFEITNFIQSLECIGCPENKTYPIYEKPLFSFKIIADDLNVYQRPIIFYVSGEVNVKVFSTGLQGEYFWYGYRLGQGSFSVSFLSKTFDFNFTIGNNSYLQLISNESFTPQRSSEIFDLYVTLPDIFDYIQLDVRIELVTANNHTPYLIHSSDLHVVHEWDRYSIPRYAIPRYAIFTGLRILNNGICYLKITMPGLATTYSKNYTIVNYVKDINITFIDANTANIMYFPV